MNQRSGLSSSRIAYQFDLLKPFPLTHGLSGRADGAPEDGSTGYANGANPYDIAENRRAFLGDLGIHLASLTLAKQVHGSRIALAGPDDRGRGQTPGRDGFPDTDGLVTDQPDLALGVVVADCVPLVLYDPARHVLCVVHAGWRGTVALIAREAVRVMAEGFGCNPRGVQAGIGPSIGPCCYEVGDEVVGAWQSTGLDPTRQAVIPEKSKPRLDLWAANRIVLESAGVDPSHIEISNVCVHCEAERYFSHRATVSGRVTGGRMMMVASLNQLPDGRGGE